MVESIDSECQEYFTDEGAKSEVCFTTNSIKEYTGESKKVIKKAHSILKSLNSHVTRYDSELTELHDTVSNFSVCLKWSRIKNFDLGDSFSRETFKN